MNTHVEAFPAQPDRRDHAHEPGPRARRIGACFLALALSLAALALPVGRGGAGVSRAEAQTYEGFGASTQGGEGGAEVRVTNLNDNGPGSLRDAVSQGNRKVVFDVAGTIQLAGPVHVKGAFITIDGFRAP